MTRRASTLRWGLGGAASAIGLALAFVHGQAGAFVVSGTATFEERVPSAETATLGAVTAGGPVAWARVRAFLADGTCVARGATDRRGRFALRVHQAHRGSPMTVAVESVGALSWAPIEVSDGGGTPHAATSDPFEGPRSDLGLTAQADGSGAAFSCLQALRQGIERVREAEPGFELPALQVRWAKGRGDVTWFDPDERVLNVADRPGVDTDIFDDAVLLHELAHFLQLVASSYSSPGGAHLGSDAEHPQDLDPRLAFSEAWANLFAQAVLGGSLYVDTRTQGGTVLDLERPSTRVLGPGSEEAIHGVLWDLLDEDAGGRDPALLRHPDRDHDGRHLGFAPLWRAFRSLQGTPHVTVRELMLALTAGDSLSVAGWHFLAEPLGLGHPLPALGSPLPAGGARGAVDASLGQSSLRAASALYTLSRAAPGPLTVTLEPADPLDGDLDLAVTAPTGRVFASNTPQGSEQVELPDAPPGLYLIRVKARSVPRGSSAAGFVLRVDP